VARLGVVAGSGLEGLLGGDRLRLRTPYGQVEALKASLRGREVLVVPRHGFEHTVPPHKVNYRANLYAMREVGVERVVALSAVGSLREDYRPGHLVVVHDFIDFTRSRAYTFYEGPRVVHVDMTQPYCPELRRVLVGMTGVPEAPLARELGLCYASLCVVTNMAAGLQERVTAEEVGEVMGGARGVLVRVLEEAVELLPGERRCSCSLRV